MLTLSYVKWVREGGLSRESSWAFDEKKGRKGKKELRSRDGTLLLLANLRGGVRKESHLRASLTLPRQDKRDRREMTLRGAGLLLPWQGRNSESG